MFGVRPGRFFGWWEWGPSDWLGGGRGPRRKGINQWPTDRRVHLTESLPKLFVEFRLIYHAQARQLPIDPAWINQVNLFTDGYRLGCGIAPKANLPGLKIERLLNEPACALVQVDNPARCHRRLENKYVVGKERAAIEKIINVQRRDAVAMIAKPVRLVRQTTHLCANLRQWIGQVPMMRRAACGQS